jgi:hypothetical protein
MNPLLKKILIGVGLLAVLFFGYRAFFGGEEEATLSSETPSGLPADNADLLSLLLELKSITLSDELLRDQTFISLQDFTVQLKPEPVGRRNPFAVIGTPEPVAQLPATTTATTATTTP